MFLLALIVIFVVADITIMFPQYNHRRIADQIALVVSEGADSEPLELVIGA